jgi:hypothetical protein
LLISLAIVPDVGKAIWLNEIDKDLPNVVFCDHEETIQHIFITFPFAKILWRIIYLTFNINPSSNITNMFGNCLNRIAKKDKGHIKVGVCVPFYGLYGM